MSLKVDSNLKESKKMTGVVDTLTKFIELEDQAVQDYIHKHNQFLKRIEEFEKLLSNGVSLGQVELAKIEYWYSKCQLYAYLIAGYYRKQQFYYEAIAEQEQANMYEKVKLKQYDPLLHNSTDAQYLSRRAKGIQLETAATHAGNYIRWNGIAMSYEFAINSIKDMVKGGKAEQRGASFE